MLTLLFLSSQKNDCFSMVGAEWIIDGFGCAPELLKNKAVLQELCESIITDLNLNVIGEPQWHQFPGHAGVTGLYLLSESHLSCHTYPEFELLTLNLYCCRPKVAWSWEAEIRQRLQAREVNIRTVSRGQFAHELSRREGAQV